MEPASDPHAAYRLYGPALVRKATRILRSQDDGVDVVHALFVDLIARAGSQPPRLDLPYLYRAVTNRSLNLLRDAATRTRLLAGSAGAAPQPTARTRCDDLVIGGQLLARLVDELDQGHLEVLVARFIDDLSQDEIGEQLGLSRKTIGKRLATITAAAARLHTGGAT